jgi:hypothetical protein
LPLRPFSANLLRCRMPWTEKLPIPIVLRDGRAIATLGEARIVMLELPVRHQVRPHWQYTADLLLEARWAV